MSGIEFTSRYEALGIPFPDPETMCHGQCEGIGFYPYSPDVAFMEGDGATTLENELWDQAHAEACNPLGRLRTLLKHREWWYWRSVLRDVKRHGLWGCDGYHFIQCPTCKGTGKWAQ